MNQKAARFNSSSNTKFQSELRKRVDAYFKVNNMTKNGNIHLYLKSIFVFLLYISPYLLITFNVISSTPGLIALCLLMGLGMAAIGMCVMHDANHGSYSKNTVFNKVLGFFSIGLLSGSSLNWRIQHNIIHHTYTNVHEHDEDIAPLGFLRFEPHAEKKKIHKYQFLYAWFFYGMMTLMWSTVKDFKQVVRYNKAGYLTSSNTTLKKEVWIIVFSKLIYYGYMLIPYFIIPEITFVKWLVGYFIMHYISGLTLAVIFQAAHVTDDTEFPLVNSGKLEYNFIEHQLRTTKNFAMNNRLVTYLLGGLNYQIEHHLFPSISHIHYPKIATIVEATAKEFNLPYNYDKTFSRAVFEHGKMLYKLGN
jgi:linoleoyl-CoA desaturase